MKKLILILVYLIFGSAAYAGIPGAQYSTTAGVFKIGTLPISCGGTAQTSIASFITANSLAVINGINGFQASQIPSAAGTYNLGSTSTPWLYLYLSSNGSYVQLQGDSAGGAGTVTFPSQYNTVTLQPLISGTSHKWISYIDSLGNQNLTQPAFSDISGTASLTSQVTGVLPIANGGTNAATASAANVFSGPTSGSAAAPSFRALVMTDLPGVFNHCRTYVVSGSPYADGSNSGNPSIYFGPCNNLGKFLTLDNGSGVLATYSVSEISKSLASGFSSATIYDEYVYNNSGTLTIDTAAWSGNTPPTRGTDAAGRLTKAGATNELCVGAFYMISSTATANWAGQRLVSNVYNPVAIGGFCTDTTASWTYGTAAWRAVNGSSTAGVGQIQFLQINPVAALNIVEFGRYSSGGSTQPFHGWNIDTATSVNTQALNAANYDTCSACGGTVSTSSMLGYHYIQRCEYASAGTITGVGSPNCGLSFSIFN